MPDDSYDFRLTIAGTELGLVLAKDQNGAKLWNQGLAPAIAPQTRTDPFSYEHVPPDADVPVAFENWHAGAGFEFANEAVDERIQEQDATGLSSHKYYYSQGIDASWQDCLYISPQEQAVSGISAAPSKIVETTLGVFALVGAYIYEYDSGSWTQRDDASGDGQNYVDLVEYKSAAASTVLIATRDGGIDYKTSTNGTSWSAFTAQAFHPKYLAVRGNTASNEGVLWGIQADGTIRNTVDPTTGGSTWSGADTVGNKSETINAMIEAGDNLYIFKRNAIYQYTGAANGITDVWRSRYLRDDNGKQAFLWVDGLVYVNYGDRLLRFDPHFGSGLGLAFEPVYPLTHNGGEVTGQITAISGDNDRLKIAIKNGSDNTYILRGIPPVMHTWAYLGANDCDALAVISPGTIHTTNPVTVAGIGAKASYFVDARAGLNPGSDSSYLFDTDGGDIVGPWVTFGAQAFHKLLNQGDLQTRSTTSANNVTLKYEVDDGSSVTLLTAKDPGRRTQVLTSTVEFSRIRYVISMTTGEASSTPQCLGTVLHATPNPPRKKLWTPSVLLGDSLWLPQGGRSRKSRKTIQRLLFLAPTAQVTMDDREGNTYVVRVLDVNTRSVIDHDQGLGRRDESIADLTIIEVTRTATASSEVFVWGQDSYNEGKVWGT